MAVDTIMYKNQPTPIFHQRRPHRLRGAKQIEQIFRINLSQRPSYQWAKMDVGNGKNRLPWVVSSNFRGALFPGYYKIYAAVSQNSDARTTMSTAQILNWAITYSNIISMPQKNYIINSKFLWNSLDSCLITDFKRLHLKTSPSLYNILMQSPDLNVSTADLAASVLAFAYSVNLN